MGNIYKYFPPPRVDFLDDYLVRFTPPADLNDPYECLPAIPAYILERGMEKMLDKISNTNPAMVGTAKQRKIAKDELSKHKKRLVESFNTLDKMREHYYRVTNENINSRLGILSLSRRWNSALMWSHYTYSYAGYCVGFNRDHKFFEAYDTDRGDRSELLAVRYGQDRAILPGGKLSEDDVSNVLLRKSTDWSYEEEERLVAVLELSTKRIEASPYPYHLFEVPSDAISEIIVGQRSAPELIKKAKLAAKQLQVPLYKTKVSDSSFDVERFEIRHDA